MSNNDEEMEVEVEVEEVVYVEEGEDVEMLKGVELEEVDIEDDEVIKVEELPAQSLRLFSIFLPWSRRDASAQSVSPSVEKTLYKFS